MVQEKIFYNISELSEMLDVPQSTIRFWEQEITLLSPARVNGIRKYRIRDVECLKQIHYLTKIKGLKISAVNSYLSTKGSGAVSDNANIVEKLEDIKSSLQQVLLCLDSKEDDCTIIKFD